MSDETPMPQPIEYAAIAAAADFQKSLTTAHLQQALSQGPVQAPVQAQKPSDSAAPTPATSAKE
jgi:hypothetical protein